MKNYYVEPIILGKRVKFLIELYNMTGKQLAEEIGISYKTLSTRLKGERPFTIPEIIQIARIFNLNGIACENIFFNPNFAIEKDTFKNKEA